MTTVTLATTPERAQYAADVVRALAPQCDQIRVYVNGEIPQIRVADLLPATVWQAPAGDLADNGKFYDPPSEGYHLTVDDDLWYPPDYVEATVAAIDRHKGRAIVSWHGTRITRTPSRNYYRDREAFRVLGDVETEVRVHCPGTGCMGYDASMFRIDGEGIPIPYMADIWAGVHAHSTGIPVYVQPHRSGWITHQEIDHTGTIYSRFSRCADIQTWLVNRHVWPSL